MLPTPLSFMQHAIKMAEQARFLSPPNPWVGCTIVKNQVIIGEGHTQPPGQSHAEVMALKQAGENARGATLYSTLEPCSHTGRTPPCVNAIIQAGIKEVYVGIEDPDLRVKGKGVRALQDAGIRVHIGLCQSEIEHQLAPYLYQRKHQLPYTVLKAALSVDGRMAAQDGSSQWISCAKAREDAHILRAHSQAIMIGANTALYDHPQLTIRGTDLNVQSPPLRILIDPNGKVPATGPLFNISLAPTLVITTSKASLQRQEEWQNQGTEVLQVSFTDKGIDLEEVWTLLGARSILQVLVEGGAYLHSSLLETSLINEMIVYMGPLLLGKLGVPFYQKEITTMKEARALILHDVRQLGETLRLTYHPK